MEMQERVEREIDLVEIFWKVILGWRQIICFSIIFAVLIGGLKYYMDKKNYEVLQNMDIVYEKSQLENTDLKKLEDAIELQTRIDQYENYQDKSALMQIDPYEKHILELQYYVQSDYIINYTKDSKLDYTHDITAMYCNYINSGELANQVIKEADLSVNQEDFRELLFVTQNESTIYLTISYGEPEKLEVISNVIKNLLDEKSSNLQQMGSHVLRLIDESQNVVVDNSLIEKKNSIANNISTLDTQLNTLKASMSQQQMDLFNIEISEIRGENKEQIKEERFSAKYLILGILFGGFLACIWIVCKAVFTVKLQNTEEIRNLYAMRILGKISVPDKKKRILSVIDQKLLLLKNRGKKSISAEQQINIVTTNIVLSCKQQGTDCIYMTGSEYGQADTNILEQIKRGLSKQNIKVKEGENICYNSASLQCGADVGNYIFVEQIGISVYDEIYNEIQLAKEQHSNLLGVIVFE